MDTVIKTVSFDDEIVPITDNAPFGMNSICDALAKELDDSLTSTSLIDEPLTGLNEFPLFDLTIFGDPDEIVIHNEDKSLELSDNDVSENANSDALSDLPSEDSYDEYEVDTDIVAEIPREYRPISTYEPAIKTALDIINYRYEQYEPLCSSDDDSYTHVSRDINECNSQCNEYDDFDDICSDFAKAPRMKIKTSSSRVSDLDFEDEIVLNTNIVCLITDWLIRNPSESVICESDGLIIKLSVMFPTPNKSHTCSLDPASEYIGSISTSNANNTSGKWVFNVITFKNDSNPSLSTFTLPITHSALVLTGTYDDTVKINVEQCTSCYNGISPFSGTKLCIEFNRQKMSHMSYLTLTMFINALLSINNR